MRYGFLVGWMLTMLHAGFAGQSVFQQGVDGYLGAVDGILDGTTENTRTESLWHEERLDIAGVPWGGAKRPALMRFDGLFGTGPKQVPLGATVIQAQLKLFKLPSDQAPSHDANVEIAARAHRNLRFFLLRTPFFAERDGGEGGYSCYSYREFRGEGRNWGDDAIGATEGPVKEVDYEANRVGAMPIESGTSDQWYEVDLTEAVQRWSAGEANHGLYVYTGGFWLGGEYASSDHPDETLRPQLTIQWRR